MQIFSATGSGYGLTYFITSNGTLQFQNTNACSEGIKPTWFDGGRGTWFDTESNKMFSTTDSGLTWTQEYLFTFGNMYMTNVGRLDYLKTKTTFHALDYNDKPTVAGWGMPSSKYINLTVGASGSTYTAPANGWIVFAKVLGNAGNFNSLQNTTTTLQTDGAGGAGGLWGRCYIPCKKGDVVRVEYNSTGVTKVFKFIYAEGETK